MIKGKGLILIFIFLILFISLSVLTPSYFFRLSNFESMSTQLPELGVLSIGMLVVIISGGLDLSITSVAALSSIVGALILSSGNRTGIFEGDATQLIIMAICTMLFVGIICGVLNGVIIAVVGVNSILATIGSMTLFKGISLVITEGRAISGFPEQYYRLGTTKIADIPVPMIIFIIACITVSITLIKTKWGRSIFMFGSNPIATKFSGINIRKINFKVYILSGVMASLAAIIMTLRYNSAKMDLGSNYLLKSIVVVILGGAEIKGGHGKIIWTILALCIFQIISTGVNILNISRYLLDAITGFILISVLLADYIVERMNNKKEVEMGKKVLTQK